MSFSGLFCSKSKYISFLQTKYDYCVYPAIQKVHNNNKILLKWAETIMFQGWPVSCQNRNKHHSIMFQWWPVSCQSRNKHHSIMFPWWPVSCRCLLLLFLIVTLHDSGIKETLSGSWLNNIEGYLIPLLVLKITWLQDKSETLLTFKHSYSN